MAPVLCNIIECFLLPCIHGFCNLTPRFSGEPAKRDRLLEPLVEQLRIVNWIVPEQTPGAALVK
jgi:hypothetical protein